MDQLQVLRSQVRDEGLDHALHLCRERVAVLLVLGHAMREHCASLVREGGMVAFERIHERWEIDAGCDGSSVGHCLYCASGDAGSSRSWSGGSAGDGGVC